MIRPRRLTLHPIVAACLFLTAAATTQAQQVQTKPMPDLANVKYGPHERNLLDLWQAKSDRPTPLVVYIHDGGFRDGDKRGVRPALLKECLSVGISVAAINYWLSHQASFPAPMLDSGRAVQLLRHNAVK